MAGLWGLVRRLILYRGLERTLEPATGCVLELGAGNGPNLPHFRRAGRLVGLDPPGTGVALRPLRGARGAP